MFLMGELKISGQGEPRLNKKGEAGKRTMYSFPGSHEFELILSDGAKDDCRFNFYVALDESENVSINTDDLEAMILCGRFDLRIKDGKGDLITLTLSAEQVKALHAVLENADAVFENLSGLQKKLVVRDAA
jgi:hypothetical protein